MDSEAVERGVCVSKVGESWYDDSSTLHVISGAEHILMLYTILLYNVVQPSKSRIQRL